MQQKHIQKGATSITIFNLAARVDLAISEAQVDIPKLITVPNDLNMISNVLDNDDIKKTVPSKLITK